MPVVPFIPLIAAGIGAAGGIASSKISANAKKASSGTSGGTNALGTSGDPLDQLVALQKSIAEKSFASGEKDIESARGKLDYTNNFYKTIMEGSPDELLKLLDASGATRSMDENEQIQTELGVRGGRRAAAISNATFARDAALNNLLKQLKFAAPNQILDIGKAFGNLGTQEMAAATSAGGQATQALINQAQVKAQEAATKAGMIGDILGVGGGIAAVLLKKKWGDDENDTYDPTSEYPASPDDPVYGGIFGVGGGSSSGGGGLGGINFPGLEP